MAPPYGLCFAVRRRLVWSGCLVARHDPGLWRECRAADTPFAFLLSPPAARSAVPSASSSRPSPCPVCGGGGHGVRPARVLVLAVVVRDR